MTPYENLDNQSGIIAYEISHAAITIRYRDDWCYLYSEASVGKDKLAELIKLAESGKGLSRYVALMVANTPKRLCMSKTICGYICG